MSGEEDLSAPADQKEVIDEKQGSILLSILKQVKIGMDLTRITLPTFILEPRSFLERMTDFMIHKDLLCAAPLIDDPMQRFLQVLKWYVAGWHNKPKGVKKPYNPVLGEEFHARWPDAQFGTMTYVAEQVTHHPPVSAVYFEDRKAHLCMDGHVYTRSKFLGNSVACYLDGSMQLYFTNRNAEEYVFTLPTAFARGVFFGALIMETGGNCTMECKATGIKAEIEFRTKGFFRGDYNEIRATVKLNGSAAYHLDGKWDSVVRIHPHHAKKDVSVFFDVTKDGAARSAMEVAPLDEQGDWESRRLWDRVTQAMLNRDYETATVHKTALEDAQRARRKQMEETGTTYTPKYFRLDSEQRWRYININLKPYDPSEEATTAGGPPAAAAAAAAAAAPQ